MFRYLLAQLSHRRSRAAVTAAGVLLASVSFVLLTATTRTSAAQVQGTVQTNLRPVYDLLVRPPDSQSAIEREQGLVRNNFETGLSGGITEAQLDAIRDLPGVAVAAPVEYVGWVMQQASVPLPVGHHMEPDTLYRVSISYTANTASTYPLGAVVYLYYASTPDGCAGMVIRPPPQEHVLDQTPFLLCYDPGTQGNHVTSVEDIQTGRPLYVPFLVAAVDPAAENALLGLNKAVASGSPLSNQEYSTGAYGPVVPVLASTINYLADTVHLSLDKVAKPTGQTWPQLLTDTNPVGPLEGPNDSYRRVQPLPAQSVFRKQLAITDLYPSLLQQLEGPPADPLERGGVFAYWATSAVSYQAEADGSLTAQTQQVPDAAWRLPGDNLIQPFAGVPPDVADTTFRTVVPAYYTGDGPAPTNALELRVIGRFDPNRIAANEQLNRVPLETYEPPLVEPGDAASRDVLDDKPLAPTANIAGYVAEPPYMITTLAAAKAFTDPTYFRDAAGNPLPQNDAPISVIRIKVDSPETDQPRLQMDKITSLAKLIHDETGLIVDITAGSSPAPQTVHLAEGKFGQPALTLHEGWTRQGVALIIFSAVDKKSIALFALILIVTALFLINATATAVRSRRGEIGVLNGLGWSGRHIFTATIGESALIGLAAGIIGTAVAAIVIATTSLDIPMSRLAFIPPVAVGLTLAAGLPAATLATRQAPIETMNATSQRHRRSRGTGRGALVLADTLRRPWQTAACAFGVAVAVAAFSVLVTIAANFHGRVAGSLLGDYVTVEVHGADWVAALLTLVLSAGFIADVLLLSVRERADDLLMLKASGWAPRHLAQIVLGQAFVTALLGAVIGSAAALTIAIGLGATAGVTMAALAAGVAVAIAVSLVAASAPAAAAARLPVAAIQTGH